MNALSTHLDQLLASSLNSELSTITHGNRSNTYTARPTNSGLAQSYLDCTLVTMSSVLKRKAEANDTNDEPKLAKTEALTTIPPRSGCPPRQVFPFMDLPQELRNMVFDELWLMSKGVVFGLPHPDVSEHGYQVKLHYKESWNYETVVRGLPLWLLLNKAVYSQALNQLRSYATFACYTDIPAIGCIKVSPILDTLLFTEVRICCRYEGFRVLAMREREKLVVPAFMSRFGPTLKTVNIATRFLPKQCQGRDFVFMLPNLGNKLFDNLQRVNFRMSIIDASIAYIEYASVTAFRDAYERQVLVHAKSILGNDMQILEDGRLGRGGFFKVFDFKFIKA